MKGLFERSREDVKLLLSRLGFAVSLPLAGYFIVNSNLSTSPSVIASAESGAAGQSAVTVSAGGGRNLKDEIHVQESEEALANIIHGTSTITTTTMAISTTKDHSPSSKNSWDDEGCHLPQLKQLSLQNPESSLMRLTHSELDAEKVDMDQEIAYIRERERSHVLDYYDSKKQQAALRELEDQLRINMMKAKSLSLKIQSLNEENQRLRIQDSEYSGRISESESVVVMIKCLIRALKSDWSQSRQKMAASEQRITMLDDKKNKDQKDDARVECDSKMLEELEDEDEYNDIRKINSSMEQKNLMLAQRLEFAENLASSCCTTKGQEVEELEANCLIEANEKTREIELLPDAEIAKMLHVRQMNACLKCEERNCESSSEKAEESYTSGSLSAKIEKKAEQILLAYANLGIDAKNTNFEEFNTVNCSSQQISNESMNSSSDMSSTRNNSSAGRSKHLNSHRIKVFSKLKKMLLGKHSHNKGRIFVDKTPTIRASFETRESASTCCLDDVRRTSCDSILSCFQEEHASTNHPFETRSTDERWRSNTAWFQSCFRSPFQVPRAKIFDLQEEDIGACCKSN